MNTPTETITPEVMQDNAPAEQSKLAVIGKEQGLAPSDVASLEKAFAPLFQEADSWAKQVAMIKVTDASQTAMMKMARTARLGLKEIRVKADKVRKSLKDDVVRRGRAIDGAYALVEYVCKPLEQQLQEQEDYIELQEAKRKGELKAIRGEQMTALGADPTLYALGEMSEETWQQLYSGIQLAKKQAEETAKRLEAEKIARETAELKAREEQRLENERLKKEAAEKEAALEAERKAAAQAAKEAAAKAKKEREALEAKARAEREAVEAHAKAEREIERKAADEAFRKFRKEEQDRALAAAAAAQKEQDRLRELAALEQKKADDARAKAESEAHKQRVARELVEAEIAAMKEREAKAADAFLAAKAAKAQRP